jgi:putative addiction module component (TIGR02574 family)
MSLTAEKVAEALALPVDDRAFLANQLIASLDGVESEPQAETEWNAVIDRRSREMEQGVQSAIPLDQLIREIRAKLHAHRTAS